MDNLFLISHVRADFFFVLLIEIEMNCLYIMSIKFSLRAPSATQTIHYCYCKKYESMALQKALDNHYSKNANGSRFPILHE